MKKRISTRWFLVLLLLWAACSKVDAEPEIKINHVGEKWLISSTTYTLINQSTSGQAIKVGTLENAGAFYFDGTNGSFDITINKFHKEDVFSFSENAPDINIISINQSVGSSSFSQHVIAISGEKITDITMTLEGSITKQSTSGQFSLSATYSLVKE